jgi:translation initiation factor 2 subunit 2
LDFSDIKKKKKSSKKKAAFDLEAFEKELNESKAKSAENDDDEDGEIANNLDHLEDADLGDDVFAQGGGEGATEGGNEAWLGSDRDYTYPEVRPRSIKLRNTS